MYGTCSRATTVETSSVQSFTPGQLQQYYSVPFWGMNPAVMPYTGLIPQQVQQPTSPYLK